jgi:carbamoyltransferase
MIEKERLTRRKYDRGFSLEMVNYVFEQQPITLDDLDCVVVSLPTGGIEDQPRLRVSDVQGLELTRNGEQYLRGPRQLDPWECDEGFTATINGVTKPAYQVQHHVAHIASAYYLSGYDKAVGLSYDGSYAPDNQTSLICKCEGTQITTEYCPHLNAGIVYDQITRRVFGEWTSAGKLMGMAAYGEPKFFENLRQCMPNGADVKETVYNTNLYVPYIPQHWDGEEKFKADANLAATAQKYLEYDCDRVLDNIEHDYGKDINLVVSGGTALNVIQNRRTYDRFPNLFIPPYCKDSGIAAGGALYVLHHIHNQPLERYAPAECCFMGNDAEWQDCDIKHIAELLADGKVVLWHQGQSEVGPRALTHRSIFAWPFDLGMKERVSVEVKGREWYRPLAPITKQVLDDSVLAQFMLTNVKLPHKDGIGAVKHVDGTARLQYIPETLNAPVRHLLDEFCGLTGSSMLINTSANIRDQSICETEQDSMWTFQNSDIDVAVINGRVYEKSK